SQEILATGSSVPQLSAARDYGNENIKPERKNEIEIGLETRFLTNKIGLDVTYYTNTVHDQILRLALPRSVGALTRLENVGELQSKGFEIGLLATPYNNGTFSWNTRLNFAKNETRVTELAEGLDEIIFQNIDAGALLIK